MGYRYLMGMMLISGIALIPAHTTEAKTDTFAGTIHTQTATSAVLLGEFQSGSASRSTTSFLENAGASVDSYVFSANNWKALKTRITAYSSTPEETDDTPFITASGTHVRDGIVATNFLPFGTKVRIPSLFGDKIFTVEDRMNPRFQHSIDIWMPTAAHALRFGVQFTEIEVLNVSEHSQEIALSL